MRRVILPLLAAFIFISAIAAAPKRPSTQPDGVPFILDSGRILLDVAFTTPDGRERKALAWFNMGMSAPVLTKALYRELGVDHGAAMRVSISGRQFEARAEKIVDGDGGVGVPTFAHLFSPRRVEAMLPAHMVQDYLVHIDYGQRIFSLREPDGKRPEGVAVPILLNPESGVAAVVAQIDGAPQPLAIDAGGGYSWMRGDFARALLERRPDWLRSHGAVGAANANMVATSPLRKTATCCAFRACDWARWN
jgi:hypothetical protein